MKSRQGSGKEWAFCVPACAPLKWRGSGQAFHAKAGALPVVVGEAAQELWENQ